MAKKRSVFKEPGNRQTPEKLVDLLKMIIVSMLHGWKTIVKKMVLIALIVLVIHTYLLVVVNEGFNYDGNSPFVGSMLAMSGRVISGTLFWILLMWVGTLVHTQIKKNGVSGMVENIKSTPAWVKSMKEETGDLSTIILVGGAGVALIIGGYLFNFLVSFMLMLTIIGAFVARTESMLLLACRLAYSDIMRSLKMAEGFTSINIAYPTIALSGALGGFLVSILIGGNFLLKIMGVALLGISYYMAKKQNDGTKPSVVIPVSIFIIALSLFIVPVMADDGGWEESGGSFGSWVGSEGAVIAVGMGVLPAIGAVAGILGGAATAGGVSSLTGLAPDGSDTTPSVTDIPVEDLAPEVDGSVGYIETENGESVKVTYDGKNGEWETDGEKATRLEQEIRQEQLDKEEHEWEERMKKRKEEIIRQNEENKAFEQKLLEQKQEQQRLEEIEKIKKRIRLNMEHNQELSKIYQEEASFWDKWVTRVSWIEKGADIGVDTLATMTGPVGQSIKYGYTATKNIGKNLSKTYANGGGAGDYGTALLKGTVETAFDIGIDKLGGKAADWTGGKIPGFKKFASKSNWTGKLGNSKNLIKTIDKTRINSAIKQGVKTQNWNLYKHAVNRRNVLISDAATGAKNALQSQFQGETIVNPIKQKIGF